MLRRVVAELLAVAKLRWRLTVHAPAGLGRLNDGRHVVGVAIDGHAAFDDVEGQALGLQIAIVDANERGELRAGGMAHDEQALRIAAVLGDMVVYPVNRLGDVAKDGLHLHVWQQSVVGRDEDKPFVHERLRLESGRLILSPVCHPPP